jgi:hypothetical protein
MDTQATSENESGRIFHNVRLATRRHQICSSATCFEFNERLRETVCLGLLNQTLDLGEAKQAA